MKTKTIMAVLVFGASVLAVNASLALDKIDAGEGVDSRTSKDHPILSSPSLKEATLDQDGGTESISTGFKLVVISGVHEGMAVSHRIEWTAIMALPEPARFPASAPFNSHRHGKLESNSTVSELIAITDMHDGMTVSQISERAGMIAVPESSTFLAGAPLLLLLFVSTLRMLRRNKMGQPMWPNASSGRKNSNL